MNSFLLAFINPRVLRDKSHIGGLFSFLIFALCACALFLPSRYILHKRVDEYVTKSQYTVVLSNIKDDYNTTIDGIKNSAYYLADNKLRTDKSNEEIKIYHYGFEYNNEEYDAYVIYDVKDCLYNKETEYINNYKALYPSDKEETQILAGVLSGYYPEKTESYHNMTTEELNEEYEKMDYYVRFGVSRTDNSYLIAFFDEYFALSIPTSLSEQVNSGTEVLYNYSDINFDIESCTSIKDVLYPFLVHVANKEIDSELTAYFILLLFDVILFPLVLALIMTIVLRNKGTLKRYKEFYSCLGILSIPTALICLILTFFIATFAGTAFIIILTLYSIIMIYRVITIKD